MAGIYTGKAEAFGSFTREAELSNGTHTVAVRQVLANDKHLVALLHAAAQRRGRTSDQDYAIIFRVDDGQIVEAWELWSDQESVDVFWR